MVGKRVKGATKRRSWQNTFGSRHTNSFCADLRHIYRGPDIAYIEGHLIGYMEDSVQRLSRQPKFALVLGVMFLKWQGVDDLGDDRTKILAEQSKRPSMVIRGGLNITPYAKG